MTGMNRDGDQAGRARLPQVDMAAAGVTDDEAAALQRADNLAPTGAWQPAHATAISRFTSSAAGGSAGTEIPSFAAASR